MIRKGQLENDAHEYVDIINGPANGWGQHCCPRTGHISHEVLRIGYRTHGRETFSAAVDARFIELKEEIMTPEEMQANHSIGIGGYKCICCGPAPKKRNKWRRLIRRRLKAIFHKHIKEELKDE